MERKTYEGIMFALLILEAIVFVAGLQYATYSFNNQENVLAEYYTNVTNFYKDQIAMNELDLKLAADEIAYYKTKAKNNTEPAVVYLDKYITEKSYNDVDTVAQEIADANEYVLDVYDCTEFSRDLAIALRNKGYTAKQKIVTVDCDSPSWENNEFCFQWKNNHAITEVTLYYEATTGALIEAHQYEDYGIR